MPSLLRTTVLVVAVGLLSCCSVAPKIATVPHLPALSSVVGGRFVARVELDNGDLVVAPAGKVKPRVSAETAQALFSAADVVDGAYQFAILGLGDATVSPEVSAATATTTGPGATTTVPGAGGAATSTTGPTTTTTHATTTTTMNTTPTPGATTTSAGAGTAVAGTTTSSAPPLTTPTAALPRYDNRLAWVGIAWDADCPALAGRPRPATRYVAVVIDADTGGSVIDYTSRSALACTGPVLGASVNRPSELVSVPWQPVGPTSTAVRVTMPACSTYFGWTEVPNPSASSVQVVVRKPFDPDCGSKTTSVQVVDDVVPLGTAQSQVPHAPVGPVDGLRTLPAG